MNADFEELYQQVILDHSKRPRNYGTLENPAIHVDGDNPSCGDEIHLHVRFGDEGQVEDVKFTGVGCAISQASASLMTLKLKGKSRLESQAMLEAFTDVVTAGTQEPPKMLGDLRLLSGVRNFPQRVKCAMLAWRAFEQALLQRQTGAAVETREEGQHCA
ncbi:MAG: SUF system NifU family Fe-S cluster assembly protein [Verrucomicrobia bacterium]|nr:SUF system NifU family Fe-S cluster assembly protein [Verrucomicrobiota bacterium]